MPEIKDLPQAEFNTYAGANSYPVAPSNFLTVSGKARAVERTGPPDQALRHVQSPEDSEDEREIYY